MWRIMLKLVHVLVIVFPLIGALNSWANPFAWSKDINFDSVADLLNQELKGCEPLDTALIENYFNQIMTETTASLQGQDFKKETKDQTLDSLHKALDKAVLVYETNPTEQLAVREAFNKKLVELTDQAIKRAQRIVSVEAAQQNYKLKKVSHNGITKAMLPGQARLYWGFVDSGLGDNKQANLCVDQVESDRINMLIKKVAFDELSIFEPSVATVKFYGYSVVPMLIYSDINFAFERADYCNFATYKESPESAGILKNKKEVLRNVLALGNALLFAHEHQVYHQRIQFDAVWISKDWSTWKFFYTPWLNYAPSPESVLPGRDQQFIAPEMWSVEPSEDHFKADIFAFTMLIELMMLDNDDRLLIAWNKMCKGLFGFAIRNGATPFTSYRFLTDGNPKPTIVEPTSMLPKAFRDKLGVFAATDPDKRGSLKELVQFLEQAYNDWDTLTHKN